MPDLVLLDLGLPAGDGFSVLERLKANHMLAFIPVFVISGRDPVASRPRAAKEGATLFLQKPVKHSALLEAIIHTLDGALADSPIVYDIG